MCRNKYKPDKHRHYLGVILLMPREVIVDNTTFIINSYSSADATETIEEILKRVIINNAEIEFKNRPAASVFSSDNSHAG